MEKGEIYKILSNEFKMPILPNIFQFFIYLYYIILFFEFILFILKIWFF